MGNGERSALKKLEGAARYWLGADKSPAAKPIAVDEEAAQALRRVGVKEEDIEAALAQEAQAEVVPEIEDFEVYEDCWDSAMFFLKVQTQWIFVGMGAQRMGFNNTALESTMRMAGVKRKDQAALLDDLQVIEREVMKVEGERAAKADGLKNKGA